MRVKVCIDNITSNEFAQLTEAMGKLNDVTNGYAYSGVRLMRAEFYIAGGRLKVVASRGRSKHNAFSIVSILAKW